MPVWYDHYLLSPHWRSLRRRKLESVDWHCERCVVYIPPGGHLGIQVHHITYERLGHERLEDLEVLCYYCHAIEHGYEPPDERLVEHDLEVDEITQEIRRWDELAEAVDLGVEEAA